jgi:eukaryotic-like serine/threonine-protein kinase
MIGETFGNYRAIELIGEGGMGVVYLAEHPGIGRRAAIKILRAGLTDNAELTKRFFNEARAANAIRHPGIVEVYDCGTLASGTSYIVMELLEGENLAVRLRRVGRLPLVDARRVAAQTASALAAAHTAGIVHRDLKPDNLFLVPDDRDAASEMVKVLDFGIAKLGQDLNRSSVSVRTRTGSVMGTPAYMSPEQCRGTREIDHRTDIYSLGVILYEMVCGRAPFVSEGFGEMVHLHISAPPPPPRTLNPAVPMDLERLILWCLAKEPDERVQTMTDVYAALTGRPTPQARPTAKTRRPDPPAPPANPTTFTQAAQAAALETDVLTASRGRKAPAIILAALALGGGGLWLTRGSWMPSRSDTVTVAPATPAPTTPAPAPRPAAAVKVPASVTAAIVSDPPGARVVRETDGAVIGMTPFRESWPSGDGVRKLRLELDGYRPEAVVVPLDRGVDLSFGLRKIAQPEPRKHKEAKHAPAAKVPAAPAPKVPAAPAPSPRPPPRSEPVPL